DVAADLAARPAFSTQVTVIASSASGVPSPALAAGVRLAAPAPNPWARGTGGALGVSFSLPAAADADLALFDLAGRRVATLARGALAAGPHVAHWDGTLDTGRRAAAGVYFVRLTALGTMRKARVAIVE